MEFKAIAQQTAEEILAYSQDISGWKVVKSSLIYFWILFPFEKKITVSKKTSKLFRGNLYRIEGIIPVSTAKLSNFLYQPENRIKWDKLLKAYNVLHKIDSLAVWTSQDILRLHIMSVAITTLLAMYVHLSKRPFSTATHFRVLVSRGGVMTQFQQQTPQNRMSHITGAESCTALSMQPTVSCMALLQT
ncbi:stAR-related lipid transfer protein 6 isoform X5 [Peromyscus maniculatus bairdii]|uniref:stAR-related lipid transfer protein 6 isoform X5 n=1 Tax=Peromyscus maniculatus bairdii TaxID=230844 RepID=UPI003FD29F4D